MSIQPRPPASSIEFSLAAKEAIVVEMLGLALRRGVSRAPRAGVPFRSFGAESREAIVAEAEAFVIHVGRVREGRVYSSEVAAGVVAALMDPASGIPASGVKAFLGTLAGAYEIGEDNGLDALAGAVERRLAEVAGLAKVRCVVSAGGTSFEVEAYEGTSLYDIVERGEGRGAATLKEHIECACRGVMACSTCHVVVGDRWFADVGAPCDAELDMLDLAYDPQPTSRLGCQLKLTKELDGLEVTIPEDAHNLMDDIPFDDAR